VADEVDTLAEKIVIDDSQALEAMANFSNSLTSLQAKFTGLQTLVDAVTAKMGGDFDAAKIKVQQLNDTLNQSTPRNSQGFTLGFDPELFDRVVQSAGAAENAFRGDAAALQEMASAGAATVPVWQQTLAGFSGLTDSREKINLLKTSIRQYSEETGLSFDKSAIAIKKQGEAMGIFANDTNKYMGQARREISESAQGISGELVRMGNVFYHVWTAMMAFQIVQWFMQIGQAIKQTVVDALAFANAMNLLVVGIRALQEAGMDVTIKQVNQAIIDLKKEFPIFTEKDIASGFSDLLLKVRDMNLSFEDTYKIMSMSMGTSILMGKTIEQTSDQIIKSLINMTAQSTKSLNDATSLSVTTLEIVTRAREMGILAAKEGYTDLTQQEKALVTLNLEWDKYLGKQQDLNALMDTAPAKAQAISAAWKDTSKNIGLAISETEMYKTSLEYLTYTVFPALEVISVRVVEFLFTGFSGLSFLLGTIISYIGGFWSAIAGGLNVLDALKTGVEAAKDAAKQIFDNWVKGMDQMENNLNKPLTPFLPDNPIGLPPDAAENTQEELDKITKIYQSAKEEIVRITDQYNQKLEDIETDHFRKLLDIQTRMTRAMIALNVDYGNKAQEISIDTGNRLATAEENHRNDELEAEQKYQEALEDLRSRFMLDLEEALRENDARTIIRLIHQYRQQRDEETRHYGDAQNLRDEQYAQEVEDIHRQEGIKLAELQREINQRRAALAVQYRNEMEDAATWRQRQLEDLTTSTNNALESWANMLVAQYDLTNTEVQNIYTLMRSYFGPNGYVDALYTYLLTRMAMMAAAIGGAFGRGTATSTGGGGVRMASGGSLFADKATNITFGEAGPEVAMFIPLRGPMGSMPSALGNAQAGGSIKLEVLLSPDLESRIVQTSVSNVALSIDKMQRQGQ
jgi:hypothetical protein